MRLVSAPLNRQFRRFINHPNLINNKHIKVVTNIPNDLLDESEEYPKASLSIIQKVIYRLKLLLDLHYKNQSSIGSFHAFYPTLYFYIARVLSVYERIIEWVLIWVFRSKEYDLIVSQYKEVQICTFDFPSELFLYSSAIRLRKRLIYGIDGWDNYSIRWVPTLCSIYQSWGEFTSAELLRKVPSALIEYVEPHFKRYKKESSLDLVVVYEGTRKEVPKHIQELVIKEAVNFCKDSQKSLIFKQLHGSESIFTAIEILKLGATPFTTSQNFTDHGKFFQKNDDDLERLIPSCAMLIVFNSSHGNLEFGLNGVPSLNIITLPNYQSASVVGALSKCGVVIADGLKEMDMPSLLKRAVGSKVDVRYFIEPIRELNQ